MNPPILPANELGKLPKQATDALEAASIIRPAAPATSFACPDCGCLRPIDFEVDIDKLTHGHISCPECGITEVDLTLLRRWAIDLENLVISIFQASGTTIAISELVPQRLWRIGKANWCGRPRELLFARRKRRGASDAVIQTLKRRPKSLLFVPMESDAAIWSSEVTNTVIALESVVCFGNDLSILLDDNYIEGQIAEAEPEAQTQAKRPTKRRASRTADIDALKRELIAHIKAARDHAVTSRDRTGEAKLLPRPSKAELGKRASVKPHSVTRCFQDPQSHNLQFLWQLADDLDRIVAYR